MGGEEFSISGGGIAMAHRRFARLAFAIICFLVLGILLFLALPASSVRANPGSVRVKVNGATSGACGNNWSNACDLQYALITVTVPGDELWVAAGTYTPTTTGDDTISFQLRSGIALYGGFAGIETARDARNPAANLTILSGDIDNDDNANPATDVSQIFGDNSCNVVNADNVDSTTILDGFTITAGDEECGYFDGGGLTSQNGNPTLNNIIFSGNYAYYGGGMYSSDGRPTLTNVAFLGNMAEDIGGGLYTTVSTPTLSNITLSSNWAYVCSGLAIDKGSATLTNVTISGNSAEWYGGGMCVLGPASPTINNTIIWGNIAYTDTQVYISSATPTFNHSIVQGGCPTGSACTNIITTDPKLAPLYNNGGATPTMALGGGSSAINAANLTDCPATDQRGYPRRAANGFCDIGAYEAQPNAIATSSGSGQATPINLAFTLPLQATVLDAYNNLLGGVVVTYTMPASGASAVLSSNPRISNASGAISTNATANGIAGAYNVTADAAGGVLSAHWGLINQKGTTTSTITSSANPSLVGRSTTFTVTVTSPSGGTPTGTVDFYEAISPAAAASSAPRKTLASQSLVNGSATFTASSLSVGAHNLQAQYSGDANYSATNSALYLQQVQYDSKLNLLFPWINR
jgi:hypothetical protein